MTLNIEIPRKTPTESSLRPRPLVVFFAFFIAKPCAKGRNYYEHRTAKIFIGVIPSPAHVLVTN